MSDSGSAHRRGLGFAGASFLTTAVLTTASAVVTSRIYGVEVIGQFALVGAPYIFVSRLSATGEQTAMVNRLAVLGRRDTLGSAIFASVLGFSYLITGTIAAIVTSIAIVLLRGPVDQPDLVNAAVVMVVTYLVIENLSWNLDAAFSALDGSSDMFVARAIQVTVFLVAAIALGDRDPVVESMVTAHIVSLLLALCWRLARVRRYLVRPTRASIPDGLRELPAILRFGIRLIPGTLANGAAATAAIWIIGATQSPAIVGAYSRAATLSTRLEEAGFRTFEITYPELVRAHNGRDGARFNAALHSAMRPLTLGLGLVIAVTTGAADGIMEVFGEGFDEAAPALAFLVAATSLYAWTVITSSMLPAMNRPGLATKIAMTRSLLIVVALFPAAIFGGITGAAAATAAAFAAGLVANWFAAKRVAASYDYEVVRPVRAQLLVPILVGAGVAFAIDRVLGGFLAIVVAGGASTIAFIVAAGMVGEIPREWLSKAGDLVEIRRRPGAVRSAGDPGDDASGE